MNFSRLFYRHCSYLFVHLCFFITIDFVTFLHHYVIFLFWSFRIIDHTTITCPLIVVPRWLNVGKKVSERKCIYCDQLSDAVSLSNLNHSLHLQKFPPRKSCVHLLDVLPKVTWLIPWYFIIFNYRFCLITFSKSTFSYLVIALYYHYDIPLHVCTIRHLYFAY